MHRRGVTCHVVKNIHEHVPPCSITGVGSGQWYSCLQWNKAILRQKNRVPWLPRKPTVGFLLVFWSNSFNGILGQDLGGPASWANGFVPMRQCVLPANYVKISKKPLVALQVLKNSNWIQFPIPNTHTQVTVEKCMTTRPAHHAWAACTATST